MKKPNDFLLHFETQSGWLDREIDVSGIASFLKEMKCEESEIELIKRHLNFAIRGYESGKDNLSQPEIRDGFNKMIDAAKRIEDAADALASIDDELWSALETVMQERGGEYLRRSAGLGLKLSQKAKEAAECAAAINYYVQDLALIARERVSGRGAPADLRQHKLALSIANIWMEWVNQRPVKTRKDLTTAGDESFHGFKDQPFTRFCSEIAALLPEGSLRNDEGLIRMAIEYACEVDESD